jgi:CheY-like chemotaxis protein
MAARPRLPTGAMINLGRLNVIVVDDNPLTLEALGQMVQGLGARSVRRCRSGQEALDTLRAIEMDLLIADAHMDGIDGFELVERLRREPRESVRQAPAILVTAHSRERDVQRARDCGANFVIAKPVTPKVLVERIYWIKTDRRDFIECDAYVGPDRRFRNFGPPPGQKGRRADDISGALGAATEPNLSQDMIDAMMKPTRVSL